MRSPNPEAWVGDGIVVDLGRDEVAPPPDPGFPYDLPAGMDAGALDPGPPDYGSTSGDGLPPMDEPWTPPPDVPDVIPDAAPDASPDVAPDAPPSEDLPLAGGMPLPEPTEADVPPGR